MWVEAMSGAARLVWLSAMLAPSPATPSPLGHEATGAVTPHWSCHQGDPARRAPRQQGCLTQHVCSPAFSESELLISVAGDSF